jgi:hypothetical protein
MAHWSELAICTGLHSEMWFPPVFKEERTAPESQYYELGKWVCDICPVREDCAEAGADEEYGLWGGMTPKDRRIGVYRPPKTYLPKENLKYMPKADPEVPMYIPEVRHDVRKHIKRRPRKKPNAS